MALRHDDTKGIPLCGTGTTGCHGDRHGLCGGFKGWDKDRLRKWEDDRIKELHDEYACEQECRSA